jgi:hypothetical protein
MEKDIIPTQKFQQINIVSKGTAERGISRADSREGKARSVVGLHVERTIKGGQIKGQLRG